MKALLHDENAVLYGCVQVVRRMEAMKFRGGEQGIRGVVVT